MKQIYHVDATERQTAIVSRDWQLFSQHPALVLIARPYRVREMPQIAADPENSAKVALADAAPDQWAVIVVNAIGATYRLLVKRDQARKLYIRLLAEYRAREPRVYGRYELPSASAGDLAS